MRHSGDVRPTSRVYARARRPQASPLFRLVSDHFRAFPAAYEEHFAQASGDGRPVVREVADKFLECGVLEHSFARAMCSVYARVSARVLVQGGLLLSEVPRQALRALDTVARGLAPHAGRPAPPSGAHDPEAAPLAASLSPVDGRLKFLSPRSGNPSR